MSGAGDRSETDKAYSQLIEWGGEIPLPEDKHMEKRRRIRSDINSKIEEIKEQYDELIKILQQSTGDQASCKCVEMEKAAFLRKMSDLDLHRVYVCGDAKRGKSAFINALLGKKELTVEHYRYRTGVFVYINKAEEGSLPEYSVVYKGSEKAKTVSEDEAKTLISADEPKIARAHISCDSPLLRHLNIELVDTPGSDSFYPDVIEDAVKTDLRWDAVLYVVDSGESPMTGKDIEQIKEWQSKQIPVGVIQTAKELVSEEGGQKIRESNKKHLTDAGAYPSLGYYSVDSALRFESEKDTSIKDLEYSSFPKLLFDAHRNWIPCILERRLSFLEKILIDLQSRKEKVEEINKGQDSKSPEDVARERAALKVAIEQTKNGFLEKVRNRFQTSEYYKKMKALDNLTEPSEMDQIMNEFDLTVQKERFSEEVNKKINEFFSSIPGQEGIHVPAPSDVGDNWVVRGMVAGRDLSQVFVDGMALCGVGASAQLLSATHTGVAFIGFALSALVMMGQWVKYRKVRCSRDDYRKLIKEACFNLWKAGSHDKVWNGFKDELDHIVEERLDAKLPLKNIAISAQLSLVTVGQDLES